MDEAFVFMELDLEVDRVKQEREAEKFWLDFLAKIYSNAPQEGESPEFARKRVEFMEAARPKPAKNEPAKPINKKPTAKELGWANIPQEEIEKAMLLREQEDQENAQLLRDQEGVEKGG